LILPLTTSTYRSNVQGVNPEVKKQVLPLGLLIGGIVCGAICWVLDGTAFWVMAALAFVLIIAGIVVASKTEGARRE